MTDWAFWLVAAAIGAGVFAAILRAMRQTATDAQSPDLAIYREQLRDVDRDLSRGTLDPAEAERLRAEVGRRLLGAGDAVRAASRIGPVWGIVPVIVAIVAAFALYFHWGAPGYGDLPLTNRIAAIEDMRAARPSQAKAEGARTAPLPEADAEFLTLMNRLREAVAANPEDLRGWRLMARNELALGNYSAAADAQAKVIALDGNKPADRAALAEVLILAANGYVSPEAERILNDTLAQNPAEPLALYYSGLMMAQGGRDDLAFRFWRAALRESPPDAGYVAYIRDAMPELAARAGARWDENAAPVGSTREQVDAMSALSAEDRAAAIGGMVQQLNDRLATRGGTAEEWARLISAYGVLDQKDRAAQIWSEARQIFTNESELATVRAAAVQAGVE